VTNGARANGRKPSREAKIAAVDAELAEVVRTLDDRLRAEHPELFDAEGRAKPGALEALAKARSRGKAQTGVRAR
jgi:hypothetical protein